MFGFKGMAGFGEFEMSQWAASRSALLTKCYSGGQIKVDEMGSHVARIDEKKSTYQILVERSQGEMSVERRRRKW